MEHPLFNAVAYVIAAVVMGLIALLPYAIAFVVIEFLFAKARRAWRSTSTRTDLGFLLLSTVYGPLTRHFFTLIIATFAFPGFWFARLNATTLAWHPAVQVLVFLLARDILIFIRHRLFHTRRLWSFHSIHHSSKEVNWLSTARFHPAELLIETSLDLALSYVLAITPAAFQVAACIIGFNNFFIHSNCALTYGPLRWIFVSPVFHRWHHSTDQAAWGKNYAAMFSFLDLMFGSFYMPKDRYPEHTGVSESQHVPESLLGQIAYPFLRHD